MAERKATNKYYPPDWDPSKGSLNTHLKQHPLRARARKLDEGILIIRFEMPFNVWCLHCNQHIGRGVRFNAEKKRVGEYYSTAIWSFRMKCHLCSGWMEIQTDPKNAEYICKEGVRRKVEEAPDEAPDKQTDVAKLMLNNPFFRIEHRTRDTKRAKELVPKLSAIQDANARVWRRDFEASQAVRRKFREQKRTSRQEERRDERLKSKLAIDVQLRAERPEDVIMARNAVKGRRRDQVEDTMSSIRQSSIFGKRQNGRLSFNVGGEDADDEPVSKSLNFTASPPLLEKRRRDGGK